MTAAELFDLLTRELTDRRRFSDTDLVLLRGKFLFEVAQCEAVLAERNARRNPKVVRP